MPRGRAPTGRLSAKKLVDMFIESIPDDKLSGFAQHARGKTIYADENMRLDLQGMCSNGDWNLQVQVNFNAKATTLRQLAPDTVASPVLVSAKQPQSPAAIKAELKKLKKEYGGPRIAPGSRR